MEWLVERVYIKDWRKSEMKLEEEAKLLQEEYPNVGYLIVGRSPRIIEKLAIGSTIRQ